MNETAPVVIITQTPTTVEQPTSAIDSSLYTKISGCSLCEHLKELAGVPSCVLQNISINDVTTCPIDRWKL